MARETSVIRPGEPVDTVRGGDAGPAGRSYVDWAAILAGAAIAAGTSVVLTTFAAGLGLGALSADPQEGISTTGLILTALFTVISMVAAYMLGGYISGRMRGRADGASRDEVTARDGIHGLVVWALGMVLGGILAVNAVGGTAKAVGSAAGTAVEAAGSAVGGVAQGAGQLAGGVVSGVGQAVGGVAQGAGEAAGPSIADALPQGLQSNPLDYISDTLLRPAQVAAQAPAPGTTDNVPAEILAILGNVVRTGEITDADRSYLTQVVAARAGVPQPEVEARVNDAVAKAQAIRTEAQERVDQVQAEAKRLQDEAAAKVEEAKQTAIDAAESARRTGVLTAFLIAASALVAAAAAYIGAVKGGRHRDENKIWGGLRYHR